MLSLLRARSTNLYRVAENFQSSTLSESSYRRIKRFFTGYTVCLEQIGRLILHWLELDRYSLCMDRTNWKYGGKDINYLVVSIAWQSMAESMAEDIHTYRLGLSDKRAWQLKHARTY